MAIRKPNGEYIVVEDISPDGKRVFIREHLDAAQRARFKTQTLSRFETTQSSERTVSVDLTVPADSSKSIRDNQIAAGYAALRTLEEFADAEDC